MLNILKVYYKYQEKSLTSYTANMFSVATYASNYNLGVTKSLTNVNTKRINYDKCIRSDLPKVINDKMATLSYRGFAFYSKRVTIGKYNQDYHLQNCYVCKQRSNWYVHKSLKSPVIFLCSSLMYLPLIHTCMYCYISTFGYFHSCTLIFFLPHLAFKFLSFF